MLVHLVARALPGNKPLLEPASAWWLMWRLRFAFANALAACLMPDHLHLLLLTMWPHAERARLGRILGSFAVRAGVSHLFERVPEAQPVASGQHLERLVRYVHLNPCRAKLVDDPLCWPWSTYRGLLGAELDPWVSADRLAEALGRKTRDFGGWLHRYVTSDPSVRVDGTALPQACPPRDLPAVPLDQIRRAALSATPWSGPAERRCCIVELASQQGWHGSEVIARAAGLAGRSVRRVLAGTSDPAAIRAAQLCLGDARLTLTDALIRPMTRTPRCHDPVDGEPAAQKLIHSVG